MSRFAALRRRQAASRRLFALECGCRDPWPCRCGQPPLSQQWVDAGADAARHILGSIGCVPLLEHEVVQALYRRGGHDRQLAQELNTLAGGEAA